MHYLQKLGCDYKELIFDCSRMFYKESRSLVLELFSGYEPVDGGEPIQNEEILAHLHELSEKDPTLQHPWEKNALEITFLRNLIWTKNETNSAFHTKLVFLYMSSISSLEDNVETLERISCPRLCRREDRGVAGAGEECGGGLGSDCGGSRSPESASSAQRDAGS